MNKHKLWLAVLSALVITPTVSHYVPSQSAYAIEQVQRTMSLGGSLNGQQAEQTKQLLGGSDLPAQNILYIDGTVLNKYLKDGSNASTGVFSSAYVQKMPAGYGVRVEIVTPNTITSVSQSTYQNAAITAGAKDVLIRVASVPVVTGEGALAGVYALMEKQGVKLSQKAIDLGQKEIKIVPQIAEKAKVEDQKVNQVISNVKKEITQQIIEHKTIEITQIQQIVNNNLNIYNININDNDKQEIYNIMKDYSETDVAKDKDTQDNLENSFTDEFEGYTEQEVLAAKVYLTFWKELVNQSLPDDFEFGMTYLPTGLPAVNVYGSAEYPFDVISLSTNNEKYGEILYRATDKKEEVLLFIKPDNIEAIKDDTAAVEKATRNMIENPVPLKLDTFTKEQIQPLLDKLHQGAVDLPLVEVSSAEEASEPESMIPQSTSTEQENSSQVVEEVPSEAVSVVEANTQEVPTQAVERHILPVSDADSTISVQVAPNETVRIAIPEFSVQEDIVTDGTGQANLVFEGQTLPGNTHIELYVLNGNQEWEMVDETMVKGTHPVPESISSVETTPTVEDEVSQEMTEQNNEQESTFPATEEVTTTPQSAEEVKPLSWSAEKQEKLHQKMHELKPDFKRVKEEDKVDYFGMEIPKAFEEQAVFNQYVMQTSWKDTNAEFVILSVYTDIEEGKEEEKSVYMFAIYQNKPVVLINQLKEPTQDGYLHFDFSKNEELTNFFKQLVTE